MALLWALSSEFARSKKWGEIVTGGYSFFMPHILRNVMIFILRSHNFLKVEHINGHFTGCEFSTHSSSVPKSTSTL